MYNPLHFNIITLLGNISKSVDSDTHYPLFIPHISYHTIPTLGFMHSLALYIMMNNSFFLAFYFRNFNALDSYTKLASVTPWKHYIHQDFFLNSFILSVSNFLTPICSLEGSYCGHLTGKNCTVLELIWILKISTIVSVRIIPSLAFVCNAITMVLNLKYSTIKTLYILAKWASVLFCVPSPVSVYLDKKQKI